jgi:hypothetical protein
MTEEDKKLCIKSAIFDIAESARAMISEEDSNVKFEEYREINKSLGTLIELLSIEWE